MSGYKSDIQFVPICLIYRTFLYGKIFNAMTIIAFMISLSEYPRSYWSNKWAVFHWHKVQKFVLIVISPLYLNPEM